MMATRRGRCCLGVVIMENTPVRKSLSLFYAIIQGRHVLIGTGSLGVFLNAIPAHPRVAVVVAVYLPFLHPGPGCLSPGWPCSREIRARSLRSWTREWIYVRVSVPSFRPDGSPGSVRSVHPDLPGPSVPYR